jgi:hypothetical protein
MAGNAAPVNLGDNCEDGVKKLRNRPPIRAENIPLMAIG